MLKRLVSILSAVVILAGIGILVWQPQSLKKRLLDQVSKKMAQSTPYVFTVGGVSGNLLTGFSFEDVRLLDKSDHSERLQASSIDMRIGLWALLVHKTIQIERLDIDMYGGHVFVRGRMRLEPALSGQFTIKDADLRLEKLLAAFRPMPPALHLTHTGLWTLAVGSQTVTVDMQGHLSEAPIILHGVWKPRGSYHLRASWPDVPLYQLWRSPAFRFARFSSNLDFDGKGKNLNGMAKASIMNREGDKQSSWAEASIRFSHGLGRIEGVVGQADTKARMQGNVDLIHRSGNARWTAEKIVWNEKLLGHIDLAIDVSERRQQLEASVDNLQFQEKVEKPIDIQSARLSLHGLSPRWQAAAIVRFRNGSSMEVTGSLTKASPSWLFMWDRLAAAFHSGGSWTSQRAGSVTWQPGGRMEVRQLLLGNGVQTFEVPLAIMEKESCRVELSAREVDPAPWLKLFAPDVSIVGTLNASGRLYGRWSRPEVDGVLNGKFQELLIPAAGLDLRDVDLDARSSKGLLEIRRLTARTKKGEIQIVGASRLPDLDFALHAHELTLKLKSQTKGTGDVDIHLGGTLQSPSMTGRIVIKEATYVVPTKEKKATPASAEAPALWRRTALDVSAEWPRNVWYRDGVTSIETMGNLRFQKSSDEMTLRLTGTIRSVRGSYNYFGRDFNIESGEIQFTGSPDMNPLLNIEASYRSDPTIIHLDITGTAEKPNLKMRSSPPLSEQDIVSVIVFGQPLNELRSQTGGSSADQRAMVAAGGVLGSYIAKGLRQTGLPELNFDVLNIQPTQQGSQLTLGRYLSRRLFISYGQALRGSAEKSITADYFLTDKWTLQGTSDSLEGNYMDLLFRYPLNKRGVESSTSRLPASPFRNSLDQPILLQPLGPSR